MESFRFKIIRELGVITEEIVEVEAENEEAALHIAEDGDYDNMRVLLEEDEVDGETISRDVEPVRLIEQPGGQ